jgi:hypothetical protein
MIIGYPYDHEKLHFVFDKLIKRFEVFSDITGYAIVKTAFSILGLA